MLISIIVGLGHDQVIGKNNDMPWHLSADLRYFAKTTKGHPIIMGRKCYESIGRPLPKRHNIIITRNKAFQAQGCVVVHSLEDALNEAANYYQNNPTDAPEVFVIGGGEIYQQALSTADRLYITYIDVRVEDGDVFFPAFDQNQWLTIKEEAHQKDEKNPYNYTFAVLKRQL
ncbi:MAG: dihydrofolate reductase [Aureispira sp.]